MLNKKIVLFIYPFFIVIIVLFFYFLFFYAPIKDNSELFPFENNDVINTLHSPEISQEILDQYGITIDAIEEKKDNYDNVYYIDGREPEEYAATPKEDAVHVRAHDIKDVSVILQCLNISQDQLNKSLVVVFCHNGTRSSEVVSKINLPNVKFLIDGVGVLAQDIKIAGSVLPSRIQDHDFAISIEDAIELIEDGAFLIDGRLLMEEDNLFDNAFEFRSAQLSTEEYNERLKTIIQNKDNKIIVIANNYADLYYMKILVYRLEKYYDFYYKDFYAIFGQTEKFFEALNINVDL